MWGRTPQRHMVSPEKNPPTDWDVESGKNVKWKANVGSKSYGNHQRAELHSWQPAVPYHAHQTMVYKWEPDKWYRLKLRVDQQGEKALVRGKVWPRDGQEPADWTLTMESALPNGSGSPGLFGNSLVTPFQSFVYYDNIQVSDNKQGHANAQ